MAVVLSHWASKEDMAKLGHLVTFDGIIPLCQAEAITKDEAFWHALQEVNAELTAQGLYITHLFHEDQVILSSHLARAPRVVPPIFRRPNSNEDDEGQ